MYIIDKEEKRYEQLTEAFPWLNKVQVIALVGAGGKTTLMYALAEEFKSQGKKVIVTTSTRIRKPDNYYVTADVKEAVQVLQRSGIVVLGEEMGEQKLHMELASSIEFLKENCDVVLIEADGAKMLPIKVPRSQEPVIIKDTEAVLGVVGLDALHQPLGKICFGQAEAISFFEKQLDEKIEEADILKLMQSEQGLKKQVKDRYFGVILNKADTKERQQSARRIMDRACRSGKSGWIAAVSRMEES